MHCCITSPFVKFYEFIWEHNTQVLHLRTHVRFCEEHLDALLNVT